MYEPSKISNMRIQPTAKSAARSSLCFLRRLMLVVGLSTATETSKEK